MAMWVVNILGELVIIIAIVILIVLWKKEYLSRKQGSGEEQSEISSQTPQPLITEMIDFSIHLNSLKESMRYGRRPRRVQESSADHSWQLTLMAINIAEHYDLGEPKINLLKAAKIAAVHDLPESIPTATDIDATLIHQGRFQKEEKKRLEEQAARFIARQFPILGREAYNLWREYEAAETPEARYIKALDKIEGMIHMTSMGGQYFDDADFIATRADSAVEKFPALKPFLRAIKAKMKKEFQKHGLKWKRKYEKL